MMESPAVSDELSYQEVYTLSNEILEETKKSLGLLEKSLESVKPAKKYLSDLVERATVCKLKNQENPIKLNIGGTMFVTSSGTLLTGSCSYFHSLDISGEKEIFIDRDPSVFHIILNYLRHIDVSALIQALNPAQLSLLYQDIKFYSIQGMKEIVQNVDSNVDSNVNVSPSFQPLEINDKFQSELSQIEESVTFIKQKFDLLLSNKKETDSNFEKKMKEMKAEQETINQFIQKAYQANTNVKERVCLNVGGTLFHTKKETLMLNKHNFFSTLISGAFDNPVDEKGEIFIDRNPTHFLIVLDKLRGLNVSAMVSDLSKGNREMLNQEMDFYGINLKPLESANGDGECRNESILKEDPFTYMAEDIF